jgi:hypothetical protein
MRTVLLWPMLLVAFLLTGCAGQAFRSETESSRVAIKECSITVDTGTEKTERPCTRMEQAELAWKAVRPQETTLTRLRDLGFGAPWSSEEFIPSPEIAYRLTKSTDGNMDMLDASVQSCIMDPNAFIRCKLGLFQDSYYYSVRRNSAVARLLGINSVNESSGMSWEAAFVFYCKEEQCPDDKDYTVVYKQWKPKIDPPERRHQRLPVLDDPLEIKDVKSLIP